MRMPAIAMLLAACMTVNAQSPTHAALSGRLYTDPANGVSFRYPAASKLTQDEPFMFPVSIQTLTPDSRSQLRALVFAKSLNGVRSWPATDFAGVEFGYDARQAATPEACRAMASPDHGATDQQTLHGIAFWHGTGGDGGMSQAVSDDIYATFLASTGSCLLFDLAIHTPTAAGEKPPSPLTAREREMVHSSLMNILDSVRIPAPSR
jgi:hypothetical protein